VAVLKPEAFLALERTVARTIEGGWAPVARALMGRIEAATAAGRFADAFDLTRSITLANIVEKHRPRLEELAVSAVLFGASRLVDLQSTSLMQGQPLSSLLQGALNQLTVMIEDEAAEHLRVAAEQVVARAEETAHRQELALAKGERLEKTGMDLADALNAAVLGNGRGLIEVGANLTTSRLVSFGFLDQALSLDIDTYQVTEILDGRHCPVCAYMHGKTFRVAQEAGRVERLLQILDPAELRAAAPWPKQDTLSLQHLRAMSGEELQNAGLGSPPYHPLCRGLLARAGTVTEVISVRTAVPAQVVEPAPTKPPALEPEPPVAPLPALDKPGLQTLANQLQDPLLRGQVLAALDDDDLALARSLLLGVQAS
jgi:hypothetical protein